VPQPVDHGAIAAGDRGRRRELSARPVEGVSGKEFIIHGYDQPVLQRRQVRDRNVDVSPFYCDRRHSVGTYYKAGILTGTVTDAVRSAPLNACVEFRRAKEPSSLTARRSDSFAADQKRLLCLSTRIDFTCLILFPRHAATSIRNSV